MVKITVAIIGCGTSGSAISAQIAKNEMFDTIMLIDSDAKKIKKLILELKNINDKGKYVSATCDATKTKKIQNELKNVDVVINAASPLCNISIMNGCLNSNTHYIDLASDPFCYPGIDKKTTLDAQLKLDKKFKQNDLIAITNTGFSPGFTDVICKHVAKQFSLNSIESIKIYFAELIESEKFILSWSPYIFLLETIFQPTVYNKGKIVSLDPEKNSKIFSFPAPVGDIKIRPFNGHPELRTIPDFIGIPVEYIEISGGMRLNNMELNDIIVESLRRKIQDSVVFNGDILSTLSSSFESPDKFAEYFKKGIIKKEIASCVIQIKGLKNHKIINYKAVLKHDLKDTISLMHTSVSAFFVSFVPSIIAHEIKLGTIKERGVIAPAALSIASHIISECKKMGLNIKESYT